jgi:acyl-CoA synthetase (AMP-forming)/AMP-acid ligase II
VLIDLLREHALAAPDHPLIATPDRSISYAESLRRAEGFARSLAARGVDRFACVVSDPAELVALICGSTAIGSEACVYSSALGDAEVGELATAFDHRHVVTDRPLDGVDAQVHAIDSLDIEVGEVGPPPRRAPALILTTGTTGRPKGARHDWSRLVAGVRRREGTANERWLLAYNLNQFAGIQVVLHVLVGGSTLVVPPSNQPRDAVAVMRDLGVTHASATPTFWRFVVGMLDPAAADEMHLQQITLGGEAVPSQVLDELAKLFPAARVSQVYASTEFGSSVSVRDGRNGLPLSVLDRDADADVQFKIVDGELHARSRVGMLGYADQDDADGWRPTGDLVEITGDRIVFVGRTSEIINVGGVKVHPLPIEELVAAVEGVAVAHVYGRSNPMTGQIVAVDVVPRGDVETDALKDAVRASCEGLPAAAQPRRIRVVDALEIRENKIARAGAPQEPQP